MICEKFDQLTPYEKIIYIGKLVHAVENNGYIFDAGTELINMAEQMGLFKNVQFFPEIKN